MENSEDCPFCRIGTGINLIARHDTILWEGKHLRLIPTVGPLVRGHVMIVPKSHSLGSLSEPDDVQTEIGSLLRHLAKICENIGEPPLFGEHGEGTQPGRPCIAHTHVHILPGLSHLVERLAARLPPMLDEMPASYIIYGRVGLEMRCDATGRRSQYFRKSIADAIGLDTWDYAAFPNSVVLEETIRYWQREL